jgi:ferredoxin
MKALRQADIKIDAPCGGNGTCKKCKSTYYPGGRAHSSCLSDRAGEDAVVDVSARIGPPYSYGRHIKGCEDLTRG